MISICIPTYEQKGKGHIYFAQLLQSIQQQRTVKYEIVVSDNSNDDQIMKVCNHYSLYHALPIRYHHNPVRGASENINNAIDLARYDKVKLMMQDDLFSDPYALERFSEALDFNSWVISDSLHINEQGHRIGRREAVYNPENFDSNTVGMPSVMAFRKSDIRFLPELKTFCDLYFYYQHYQAYGLPVVIYQKHLVSQRFHNDSLSRNQAPSHHADKMYLLRRGLIPGKMPKTVVSVVVYDRIDNAERWLRCWRQSDTRNAELVIIHNSNEDCNFTYLFNNVENAKVIGRKNIGYDIGALQDVARRRLPGFPDYDFLLWCTDDTIPMDPDFIARFTDPMEKGVGVTCMQISQERTRHVRTTGFCMRRETVERLKFPADPIVTKAQCLSFEHGQNISYGFNMLRQIERLRLAAHQVAPLDRSPLYDMGFPYRNAEALKTAHLLDRMAEHEKIFGHTKTWREHLDERDKLFKQYDPNIGNGTNF